MIDSNVVKGAARQAEHLSIRLLGGFELRRGSRELSVPAGQARSLLAYLIEHRERPIERSELVEAVWPEAQPSRPDIAIRSLLSRLRAILGAEILRGRGVATVDLPPLEVDVERASALVDVARAATAAGVADDAARDAAAAARMLAADYLPGMQSPWIEARRGEVQALAEEALLLLATAALTLQGPWLEPGRRAAAELVERAPDDERGYALLIQLNAAVGEGADALRAYDALRRRLADQFGVAPSPELRDLHLRLVRDRASTGLEPLPEPAPLRSARAGSPLVGRTAELSRLEAELARCRDDGRLVFIRGEPGVGKTRLIAELSERAHAAGHPVLFGRCDPASPPFGAVIEALAPLAHEGHLLAAPLGERRRWLARLIPQASLRPAEPDDAVSPEVERTRMFEATLAVLEWLGAENAPLLVLEDAQWARPGTLGFLAYLARHGAHVPLLVAATMREPDPDRGDDLPELIAQLSSLGTVAQLSLDGLGAVEVREAVGAWTASAVSAELAQNLHELTDGNPFFLRSTVAELGARAEASHAGLPERLGPLAVPRELQGVIASRVRRLGDDARLLLEVAAVLGREWRLSDARLASGLDVSATVAATGAAREAGLVIEAGANAYRFVHALVRQALLDGLGPARRTQLEFAAGQAIERRAGRHASRHSAALARHFGAALEFGAAQQALRYAEIAAGEAERALGFDEAADFNEIALRAIEALPELEWQREFDALMALGRNRNRASSTEVAAASFRAAAELASEHADDKREAQARRVLQRSANVRLPRSH